MSTIVKNDVWPNAWQNASFRRQFVVLTGASFVSQESTGNFWESALRYKICEAENLLDLMHGIQCLLWALQSTYPGALHGISKLLNDVFDISPNVIAHIAVGPDGPTLFPGGAKLLDDALISDNLEWLSEHPQALKSFQAALSTLLSKDAGGYRNLLDNLRFAVEQLVKDVLGIKKA